ncbi:MAG: flagellar basal body L-ring protein FlgH [Nitrospiria bacterium]
MLIQRTGPAPWTLLVLLALPLINACGMIHVTDRSGVSSVDASRKGPQSVKISIVSPNRISKQKSHSTGSLWKADQSRNFFFQDAKAGFVGDIVTVRIVENAKGSKDAKTKTARSSSLSASTPSFFGTPANTLANLEAGTEFSNAFDGDGSTSRSGSLTADVTAVVSAVYPNGNMQIKGEREVSINNEKEYLSVSGVIRPEDIGPGNTVLSTVIADAKIEYSGSGAIDDKQRPGWLMRIIDFIWPF